MSTQFPLTIIAKDCFGKNQVLDEDAYKEYSSEKAALHVIDRFCTDKSITNGLKVIGEAAQYLDKIRQLKQEIRGSEKYEGDKLGVVVCDIMLVTNNAIQQRKADKKLPVDIHDGNPNAKEVIEYFDEKNAISKKHEIYRAIDGKFSLRRDKIRRIRKKMLPFLILILICGLILTGIAIAGFAKGVPSPEMPKAENIFDSVSNWWNYDLWGKDLPVEETSQLRLWAPKNLTAGIALIALLIVYAIFGMVVKKCYLKSKNRRKYMIEWCEFCYLSRLFEYAEKNMF